MTRIDDKDFFHGAALMQIVSHDRFTALNEAADPFLDGYYWVNHNTMLYLKYASNIARSSSVIVEREDRKVLQRWSFSFSPSNLNTFNRARRTAQEVYFAGVCGSTGICLLTSDELLNEALDPSLTASQTFEITRPPGKWFRVGTLKRSMSDFPKAIFN